MHNLLLVFFVLLISGNPLIAQPPANATPFGMVKDSFFTNIESRVYTMDRIGTKWNYAFDLPFAVHQEDVLRIPDTGHILVIRADTNLLYYDLANKTTKTTSSSKLLQDFCNSPIKKIIFYKGSAGCFATNVVENHYDLNQTDAFSFSYSNNKRNKAKLKLPLLEEPVEAATVQDFLKKLPGFSRKKIKLADLGFTNAELTACKQDVLAFCGNKKSAFFIWNRESIKMNQLVNLTDSLENLSPGLLQKLLFHPEEIVSTGSFSVGVQLINDKGETLQLHSAYFSEPNRFYFPWFIYLNGYQLKGNWPEVSQFLEEIYPGLLKRQSGIKMLHTLVRNLYYYYNP